MSQDSDNSLQKFEDVTLDVMNQIIDDLSSDKDWIRLKAQEIILNRTLPARKMRAIKFAIKSMNTIQDVVQAKEEVILKMAKGKINAEEALIYLSIVDNIKDTLIAEKYIKLILEFKQEAQGDVGFQAFLNNTLSIPFH